MDGLSLLGLTIGGIGLALAIRRPIEALFFLLVAVGVASCVLGNVGGGVTLLLMTLTAAWVTYFR